MKETSIVCDFTEYDDIEVAKNFLLNILGKITVDALMLDSRCDNTEELASLTSSAIGIVDTLNNLRQHEEYEVEEDYELEEECEE